LLTVSCENTAHIATGPDPSVDLISLYGLGPVAKSVARNDPVTGEKINRLRKSYEGKLKGLGLAGRNKAVKHDPATPGGLRQMTMWPEEEWQNQKVFGKEIKVADMDSALYNLQMKAMKMEPGTVPNNDYWEDVLGHDKPTKNANAGEGAKKTHPSASAPRAVSRCQRNPSAVAQVEAARDIMMIIASWVTVRVMRMTMMMLRSIRMAKGEGRKSGRRYV
jgi:hypothetical protein